MKYALVCVLVLIYHVDANSLQNTYIINKVSRKNHVRERYKPEWNDLDTRPLPQWYDQAKIGIFLHWGVYSVPSYGSEWFWGYWKNSVPIQKFMAKNYPPGFTYQQFASSFTADFFYPDQWAKLFKKAGAKYVVLTTKHHDGFTLFPSKKSFSWNAIEVGPHRDLVGDLATAVRKQNLVFGVYYSLYEWFNPIYLEDKANHFKTYNFPQNKLRPDMEQIINDYKPSVFWSDGDWEAPDTYWNSTDFLAWLYNDSPVKEHIVVNDRWGIKTTCKHGDFFNCADHYHPKVLQSHKWENAFTVDKYSWGYRKNMFLSDIITIAEILANVIITVSCGGNALINVGPTKHGTIAPIFQERLLELGQWLDINGEAIYNSSPWLHQNDDLNDNVWYTCTKDKYNAMNPTSVPLETDKIHAIYAIFWSWPFDSALKISDISPVLHSGTYKVEMLGQSDNLEWEIVNGITDIKLPSRYLVGSKNAWALKFSPFKEN